MPAHLHDRRALAYLCACMGPEARVIHWTGELGQTRDPRVAGRQAAPWRPRSIRAGATGGSEDLVDMGTSPMEAPR